MAVTVPRLLTLFLALGCATVAAHVNDRGMDYSPYKDQRGIPCCNDTDCRPADDYAETTIDGRPVVRLLIDGMWITVSRYFVVAEDATDGRAHWCGKTLRFGATAEARPVPTCIILPPRNT
ncbi:MAG: hypothetical protein F9K29_20605 [Hyphomicrobiaceae bacterium]|nr:MAG: hypothetical protein F9K29_20605 [Hyphomicrobiaceae bacterium]